MQNTWVPRVVDLSPFAGRTQDVSFLVEDAQSGAGDWEEWFADIALIHLDGTVIPLYNGEKHYTFTSSGSDPYMTNQSVEIEQVPDTAPLTTVHYYLADQVGTTREELAAGGWPVWQGFFTPFGQEIVNGGTQNALGQVAPDGTQNPYKFTGKERDTESGLDYFGARYYASSMGRWMSPDWATRPEAVPYSDLMNPQSLNLYAYVNNKPLIQVDQDGHFASPWHFLLSFVAAITTGHNPIYAAKLGYRNVLVDVGTQGGTPDQTGIHGMGAGQESASDAYQNTVQALAKEQAINDVAGEQHTVQDPWASGHDYKDWPGSFAALGVGGTIMHELGDWLPTPWAFWGALVRSIRALQNPNATPDELLRKLPTGTLSTTQSPPPPPQKPSANGCTPDTCQDANFNNGFLPR